MIILTILRAASSIKQFFSIAYRSNSKYVDIYSLEHSLRKISIPSNIKIFRTFSCLSSQRKSSMSSFHSSQSIRGREYPQNCSTFNPNIVYLSCCSKSYKDEEHMLHSWRKLQFQYFRSRRHSFCAIISSFIL